MRAILSNEDAQRLRELIEANPDASITLNLEDLEDAGTIIVGVEGSDVELRARPRRTPSDPGGVVIEDMDGRSVAVAS